MAFEIFVKGNHRETINDEIMALFRIFLMLSEENVPETDIRIRNTVTGEDVSLNTWTGTEYGEKLI